MLFTFFFFFFTFLPHPVPLKSAPVLSVSEKLDYIYCDSTELLIAQVFTIFTSMSLWHRLASGLVCISSADRDTSPPLLHINLLMLWDVAWPPGLNSSFQILHRSWTVLTSVLCLLLYFSALPEASHFFNVDLSVFWGIFSEPASRHRWIWALSHWLHVV